MINSINLQQSESISTSQTNNAIQYCETLAVNQTNEKISNDNPAHYGVDIISDASRMASFIDKSGTEHIMNPSSGYSIHAQDFSRESTMKTPFEPGMHGFWHENRQSLLEKQVENDEFISKPKTDEIALQPEISTFLDGNYYSKHNFNESSKKKAQSGTRTVSE